MMERLRTHLRNLLKLYHPQVHYQVAPTTATFPYIVLNLPNSFTNEEQEIFSLDIDIWDNRTDTTELESLASKLWKELHHYRYSDDEIQFSIYRENRIPELDETEIGIRRRKLIFQLRYFDRTLLD